MLCEHSNRADLAGDGRRAGAEIAYADDISREGVMRQHRDWSPRRNLRHRTAFCQLHVYEKQWLIPTLLL